MRLIDADALGELVDSHNNIHYEDIVNQPTIEIQRMSGWICPVCGQGLSPFIMICPCKGSTELRVYTYSNGEQDEIN